MWVQSWRDEIRRNQDQYLLFVLLLVFPLLTEILVDHQPPQKFLRVSGNRNEDDDFGFLALPYAEWMEMRREWTGFVDLDEALLRDEQEQRQAPWVISSGSSLKSRLRALSELSFQDDNEVNSDDAHQADLLARHNPPPLAARVPKIIHQTWKSYQVQSVFENYTSSWRTVYPDWEYWFWTDQDVEALVRVTYPRYKKWFDSFDGYAYFIQRADTWKYLVLFAFGGVYADLDVQALRPFDDSLMAVPLLLSTEPNEHSWILNHQEKTVCNAFMSSVPSHPFWLHVLHTISQRTHIGDPVDSTGPRMLQTVLDEYNAKREEALKARGSDSVVWREFPQVVTATPELYMPFFDRNPVQQKCESEYIGQFAAVYWLSANELHQKAVRLCRVLKQRDFANALPESAFTVHHWSHTWLGHVTDRVTFDISSQISVGPNRSQKLPLFESEAVWIEKTLLWDLAIANISDRRKRESRITREHFETGFNENDLPYELFNLPYKQT